MSMSEEVKSEEEASGKKSGYTRSSEKDEEEEENDCNVMEWECEALTYVREVPQSFALFQCR